MANDFLIFAGGVGANVITQEAYAALATLRSLGFQTGIADATQLNKVWRQSSIISSMIGQFIFEVTGEDAIDDGSIETLLLNFQGAINTLIRNSSKGIIVTPVDFSPSVTDDGQAVYWDTANEYFDLAIADGSAAQNVVGVADVTNNAVYLFGVATLFTSLTPGGRYYLSGSSAGDLTLVAPIRIVAVGIAKTATEMYIDIDPFQGILATTNNTFTKAQRGQPSVLPNLTGNAAIDWSAANNFYGQVTGDLTFDNGFTNAVAGQSGLIRVQQNGSTAYNWAFGSYWQFAGGATLAPAQTQTLGAYDEIVYHINSTTAISFDIRSDVKS